MASVLLGEQVWGSAGTTSLWPNGTTTQVPQHWNYPSAVDIIIKAFSFWTVNFRFALGVVRAQKSTMDQVYAVRSLPLLRLAALRLGIRTRNHGHPCMRAEAVLQERHRGARD